MKKLYGALFALSIIWGTSFLFIKILLEEMTPSALVFGRCFFGTLMLILIALIRKDQLWSKENPWIFIILIALLNNVIPWLLISSSETKISSSLASILNATTPIWTLMIGFLFFASTLNRKQWFGIFLGFCGILILSDIHLGEFHNNHLIGVIYMISAAVCYGVAAHLTRRYLKNLSVMQISFYTLFISTLISFVVMIITSPNSLPTYFHFMNLLPLFCLGALGSGVAYLFYFYLVTKGSAEFASFVTYLVPVSAILWGRVLLKEEVHPMMVLGLLIIFIGIYITSNKSKNTQKKENSVA